MAQDNEDNANSRLCHDLRRLLYEIKNTNSGLYHQLHWAFGSDIEILVGSHPDSSLIPTCWKIVEYLEEMHPVYYMAFLRGGKIIDDDSIKSLFGFNLNTLTDRINNYFSVIKGSKIWEELIEVRKEERHKAGNVYGNDTAKVSEAGDIGFLNYCRRRRTVYSTLTRKTSL